MDDTGRIDEILGDWAERWNRGEKISPEEVLSAFPDHAGELAERFASIAAAETADPAPSGGTRLRPLAPDRYHDFKIAGEGGMGIVYWALDTDLNRQVAFKIVRPDLGKSCKETPSEPIGLTLPGGGTPASQAFEALKTRFLQEAWVTAGLEHPGIVPVYELGATPDGVPYYTMRFVRGSRTLSSEIEIAGEGGIAARLELLEPFLRVCDTIRYAHAHGVIHRDLKPDNVALGDFGEVVVLDWGLAKMRDSEDAAAETWQERLKEYRDASDLRTIAGAMGTPGYMAPEAAMGRVEEMDERSDVYSLGSILYKTLTGRLPFEFDTYLDLVNKLRSEVPPRASKIDPSVPGALSEICERALARRIEDRYAGAGELAAAVRAWQKDSVLEQEVRELLVKAEAAYEGTEGLEGEALLKQLDRVTVACARITERAPGHPRAAGLVRRSERTRERAIAEREKAARGRLLRRVAALGIGAVVLLAALVIVLVDQKRRVAEDARARAEAAEETTARALAETEAERDAKDLALTRARSLALTSASALADTDDPQRSLLLACAAARIQMSPDVAIRLHDAVGHALQCAEFRGHLGRIQSALFSPDGDRVLTASSDGTARLWDLSGHQLSVLRGHWQQVDGAVFSPRGDRIVTWSRDRTVRIWDLQGRPIRVLTGHTDGIFFAGFSADGARLLSASADRTVRIWSIEGEELAVLRGEKEWASSAEFSATGRHVLVLIEGAAYLLDREGNMLARLDGHEGPISAAAFSPSGDRILTASQDSTARLWSLGGEELVVFKGHDTWLTGCGFFPSGERIFTTGRDLTTRVWDVDGSEAGRIAGPGRALVSPAGDRVATTSRSEPIRLWDSKGSAIAVLSGHDGVARRAMFSPDGAHLLTVDDRSILRVWDREGNRVADLRGHRGRIGPVAMSPGGKLVLTAGWEESVARLWRLEAPEVAILRHGMRQDFRVKARVSPDGELIAAISGDDTVTLWDAGGRKLKTVKSPSRNLLDVVFSPAGDRFLTVPWQGTAILWDLEGELAARLGRKVEGGSAAFSPDGDRILTFGFPAHLWSKEGEDLAVLTEHSMRVTCGAFSPDGKVLLTGSEDASARLWSPESDLRVLRDGEPPITAAKELRMLSHRKPVTSVSFSPSGGLVLTTSVDGTARLFDQEGRQVALLGRHEGPVRSGVFSAPSGAYVLTASDDRTARLWNLQGDELAVMRGHAAAVTTAEFSPTGDRILTGSDDGTARLWDFEGRPVAVLRGHLGPVRVARFFPSGRRILTASSDGTARVWLADENDLLRLAEERICRGLTTEEWERYGKLLGEEPAGVRAERLVAELLRVHEFPEDVTAAVEADPELGEEVRSLASRMAEERRFDRERYHRAAYEIARLPGREQEEYDRALRLAEAAHTAAPDSPVDLSTLGIAQYRSGRFEEAVATLGRARELNPPENEFYPGTYDLAFLAMSLHRLGREPEARAALDRCLEQLEDPYLTHDEDWRLYIEEARAVVGE